MLRRTLILAATFLLSSITPLFAADVQALLAAAAKDPSQIPALVTQGSVELARLSGGDAKKAAELGDALEPFCRRLFFSSESIPAGSPKNVLGGYWIALDANTLGTTGIGLHGFTGTPSKNWIEQPASHGCVRMLQHDIDRVFHVALEGTPVVITK